MSNNKPLNKKSSKVKSIDSPNVFDQKPMESNYQTTNHNSNETIKDVKSEQLNNANSNLNQPNKTDSSQQTVVSEHSQSSETKYPTSSNSFAANASNQQNVNSEKMQNQTNIKDHHNKEHVENSNSEKIIRETTDFKQIDDSNNAANEPLNYQKLYERSQFELEKLRVLYNNAQGESLKLKITVDNERKQLIEKLEEKSKLAQLQVEQKISHLELTKKEEITKIKESLASDIINSFIDPILLFESTIENAPKDNPTVISYLQGYTMIVNMFKERLDNLGVQQIDVRVGDAFNEKFMSAFDIEHVPGIEQNRVIKIVSKGFVLNKKIIKYVSVIVSK